jgi:hypothetical protein
LGVILSGVYSIKLFVSVCFGGVKSLVIS